MTSDTDARGHQSTYSYNVLDQRVQTNFADGSSVSSAFDKRGLEISKTDQNSRTTEFGYDGLGRLVSVSDALNQITHYSYDEAGNKLTQSDALGRVTTWAYDAIGRPVNRTLPQGQRETYAYDATGNRSSHTDFNGATHSFTHDSDNDWLISENWADGNQTTYAYNANGQRSSATDADGTFSYSYDNRDRLAREIKHDGSELVYGYDTNGNRTSLSTVVAGVTSTAIYSFDALNRMASVADTGGNTTDYTYDGNSNQTRIDQANGTATTLSFDELNRVTDITHLAANNSVLSQLSYTLDSTGRRTAITEASGRTSTYSYDALYRLTGESITDPAMGNHNASYSYDAVSNRTQQQANGITTAYSYDDNDRLLNAGNDIYNYDDNGNTVSEVVDGQSATYTYNSQNRLIEANRSGVVQGMRYDPKGARIQKTTGGEVTDYLVDANRDYAQVLYERSPTTALNYTFGTDLVGLDTGSESYTYHTDALGSTRLLTDGAGSVADEVKYDAWGEQLSGGAVSENQYLYTGEQYDGYLNQYYLRARYLNSSIGRFSQHDVWMGARLEPISLNKYIYGNVSPSNNVDPTGYYSIARVSITLGLVGSLTSSTGGLYTSAIDTIVTNAESFNSRNGKFGILASEFKASIPSAYLLGELWRHGGSREYFDLVKTSGHWDYKNRKEYKSLPENSVVSFGNFAFGGSFAAWADGATDGWINNYPELTRFIGMRGAGYRQEFNQSDKYKPEYGHFYEIWSDRTGDSPEDMANIWMGTNYYYSNRSMLLESVR